MIKPGSYVRIFDKDYKRWAYGEVTLIKDDTAKVIWQPDSSDLNYDYYPIKFLEEINKEEFNLDYD